MNKFEKGEISFSIDDIKNAISEESCPNKDAYIYVNQAMTTSSHVIDKDTENVEIDDIYPITKEECDEMSDLLDKAEGNIKDPSDKDLTNRIAELRSIVAWSKERHWTIRWMLIVACLISAWFFNYKTNESQKRLDERTEGITLVNNWAKQDTTIAYESITHDGFYYYEKRLSSAGQYKLYYLAKIKESITHAETEITSNKNWAAVATDEKSKKEHEEKVELYEKSLKENQEKFEEAKDFDFDDIKELAEKEVKQGITVAENTTKGHRKYLFFLILLLPLYILSCHQWGYEISRRRAESEILSNVEKALCKIAIFFFGAGLAMKLLPDIVVKETWSDGHTTTRKEADTGNAVILVMKGVLMIAGLVIFCLGSILLMTYLTITGLKRNYDWKAIFGKITAKAQNK